MICEQSIKGLHVEMKYACLLQSYRQNCNKIQWLENEARQIQTTDKINIFKVRVINHWDKLTSAVVDSEALEILKLGLDVF